MATWYDMFLLPSASFCLLLSCPWRGGKWLLCGKHARSAGYFLGAKASLGHKYPSFSVGGGRRRGQTAVSHYILKHLCSAVEAKRLCMARRHLPYLIEDREEGSARKE